MFTFWDHLLDLLKSYQSVFFTDQNRQIQEFAFKKEICNIGESKQFWELKKRNIALVFINF